jgi:Cellulose synthase/PilZ domain
VYHHEYLAYGIAAQTLKPFNIQRQRWGVGSWQVFVRANPIFMKGLTLPQRICYLSAMIYPLEGLQKVVFYLTPPIALFTGVLPMRALNINYLAHFIPYFLISTYGFNEMARGVGGQIMLEQYSMAKFYTYLKTMVIPFMPRKGKVFSVTPKEEKAAPTSLIIPQVAVILLSFTAIVWGNVELLLGRRSDGFIVAVNSFWALYNGGLALTIVNFNYKKIFQRRANFRTPDNVLTYYRAIGEPRGRDAILAVANNITEEGMSMFAVNKVPVGDEFEADLMLPLTTVCLRCRAVRERTLSVDQYHFSETGLRFVGISRTSEDVLCRYIDSSAVTKFMREYHQGYQTFVARLFDNKSVLHKRAARSLAYLPVEIRDGSSNRSFAVIKYISETGLLLEAHRSPAVGQDLTVEAVLGKDRIPLNGRVVRSELHSYEHFPLFIVGVQFGKDSSERVQELLKIARQITDFILL